VLRRVIALYLLHMDAQIQKLKFLVQQAELQLGSQRRPASVIAGVMPQAICCAVGFWGRRATHAMFLLLLLNAHPRKRSQLLPVRLA
jgi:hypothetical protein